MVKDKLKRLVFKFVLGPFIYGLYRLFVFTWRVQIIEPPSMRERIDRGEPIVMAHWHGDELALLQIGLRYRVATISSTSVDGEMMNSILFLIGAKTSRGSSTRGAVNALKGLLRLVKSGWNCTFAVDGPKGPIYQIKPGVFEVSRLAALPIYGAGVAVDKKWTATKSWNQAFLPKPFARVVIKWSEPLGPITKEEDPRSPELAQRLAEALRKSQKEASEILCDT